MEKEYIYKLDYGVLVEENDKAIRYCEAGYPKGFSR